jgi:hypothetical protein
VAAGNALLVVEPVVEIPGAPLLCERQAGGGILTFTKGLWSEENCSGALLHTAADVRPKGVIMGFGDVADQNQISAWG